MCFYIFIKRYPTVIAIKRISFRQNINSHLWFFFSLYFTDGSAFLPQTTVCNPGWMYQCCQCWCGGLHVRVQPRSELTILLLYHRTSEHKTYAIGWPVYSPSLPLSHFWMWCDYIFMFSFYLDLLFRRKGLSAKGGHFFFPL